jgi:hypothetical protein
MGFRNRLVLVLILIASCIAQAQTLTTQPAMHNRVLSLYSFSPSKISKTQQSQKSLQMDQFWKDVKADPEITLPLLRVELADTSNPSFFMMDGASLLLSLSKETADADLAARAIPRADLKDVVPSVYFSTVHDLSIAGADTTQAGLHILDDPTFRVPLPQHAMTLSQPISLVYLLLPVDQNLWLQAALDRFASEKDEVAQISLLTLFFFSQTKEGDQVLATTAQDSNRSEIVRNEAAKWIKVAKDVPAAKLSKVKILGSEEQIRERRAKRLGSVSDESLSDVQDMTTRIIQLRRKK